jgi:hypothetical protein
VIEPMTSIAAASVSALRALRWSNASGVPGLISGGKIEAPVITALTAGPTESVPDSKGNRLWTPSSSSAS